MGTTEHVEIEIGPSVKGGKDNVLENSQKTKFEQSTQTPDLPAPTSMPAAPSPLPTPAPTTHLCPDEGTVPRRSGWTTVKPMHDDENPKLTLTSYSGCSNPTTKASVGNEHAKLAIPQEPSSFKEAMALPEADHWMEACIYKMEALSKNQTFRWVERPAD